VEGQLQGAPWLSRLRNSARLRAFDRPVRIVFGAADPYLNIHVARRLARLFPTAELTLLPGAHHYVQVDEPGSRSSAAPRCPLNEDGRPNLL